MDFNLPFSEFQNSGTQKVLKLINLRERTEDEIKQFLVKEGFKSNRTYKYVIKTLLKNEKIEKDGHIFRSLH